MKPENKEISYVYENVGVRLLNFLWAYVNSKTRFVLPFSFTCFLLSLFH